MPSMKSQESGWLLKKGKLCWIRPSVYIGLAYCIESTMYIIFTPMLHRKRRPHQAPTSTARMVQRETWLGIRRNVSQRKKTDLPDAIVIIAFYPFNQDPSQSLSVPI